MINRDWLESLRFETVRGGRVTGLEGVGEGDVVFRAEFPDVPTQVLKVSKTHIGFHLGEIPPVLTPGPCYDVDRLNRKLLTMLGSNYIDCWSMCYDHLYAKLLLLLYEAKIYGLIIAMPDPSYTPFVMNSPGMQRRLEDLSTISNNEFPENPIITVNAHTYRFVGMRDAVAKWAADTLTRGSGTRLGNVGATFHPEALHVNPLFVWGAAVLDGFFTEEEMPLAVDFISRSRDHDGNVFGELAANANAILYSNQIGAILELFGLLVPEVPVYRLKTFCDIAGFHFY